MHNKCLEAAMDSYSSAFACTRLRCAWIYGVPNRDILRSWPSADAANVPLLSKLRRGEAVYAHAQLARPHLPPPLSDEGCV